MRTMAFGYEMLSGSLAADGGRRIWMIGGKEAR